MITIEFVKDKGVTVKNNGQEISGIKNVKVDIDSNIFGPLPQIILTIESTDIKINSEINLELTA